MSITDFMVVKRNNLLFAPQVEFSWMFSTKTPQKLHLLTTGALTIIDVYLGCDVLSGNGE
jgi:hypothetical protein